MKRYFESLRPGMCLQFTRFPMGSSWCEWIGPNIAGTSRNPITRSVSPFSNPNI